MNLELTYPDPNKEFDLTELPAIPNKHQEESGYLLIAMVRSYLKTSVAKTTLDRYVCFTNYDRDQVWIEKLTILRAKRWFAIDDTKKIEDNEEHKELLRFLMNSKVLDG